MALLLFIVYRGEYHGLERLHTFFVRGHSVDLSPGSLTPDTIVLITFLGGEEAVRRSSLLNPKLSFPALC